MAELPLSWAPVDVTDNGQVSQWMHAALAVLRALAILETPVSEQDKDLTSSSGKAMERLEAKLDLSLVLLMQLTRQSNTLPPCHQITLRADSVEWASGALPEPGQSILLTLYLNAGLPIALTLPAMVTKGCDSSAAVRAIFLSLDEDVDEWLSRTLFRYHRRQIQLKHDQKDRG